MRPTKAMLEGMSPAERAEIMMAQRKMEGTTMTTTTTTVAVTDEQIGQLRTEAGEHGDLEQVALCDRALSGDDAARRECERVIEDAEGMDGA